MEAKPRPNKPVKKRKVDESHTDSSKEVYDFKVLLPNGTSVMVSFTDPQPEMLLADFVRAVRDDYKLASRSNTGRPAPKARRRDIDWNSNRLYLQDSEDHNIRTRIRFSDFDPFALNILRLYDGSPTVPETYEGMWDLTPDTDLLKELPQEYSFEAALAELIDNSLQAVWKNDVNERRLISVQVDDDKISVFDTGPGMDASEQYSIVKWGKMGASLHRSDKRRTTGRNIIPPYLLPFFGMFGYGGPIASMHLGRLALVSSKRKCSKKVYTLVLERDALLSGRSWKADGGMRNPSETDIQKSPHGSFTKVEIYNLKMRSFNISELQWRLKDIYFPYIQCDDPSSAHKTTTPVEFEVNGLNLAEVEGGESAVTNWFSCNGPDFVFQIKMHVKTEDSSMGKAGLQTTEQASACLKCVYFPIKEGKESIDMILEKLNAEGVKIKECFSSFNRVSIRRLGRLLPDARWPWLPFMDLRQKKGERAQTLKRCCTRVKCFIDTDGGFSPTRSKTDLAHRHAFTSALKNFGNKSFDKEKEMKVDIIRDGKKLSILQLMKEYLEWILSMHDKYDDENECCEDQPFLVVTPDKKRLGVSSDVVRVHKEIQKNGILWKSGQKMKILKGACPGCHNKNVYATLERIVLGGLEGDLGGESQLICRPIGVRNDEGCFMYVKDGDVKLDMRRSLSIPLNLIDSGKCVPVENTEWNLQLAKLYDRAPTMIEMLNPRDCQTLDIDGILPLDTAISAGQAPPHELVAVIRPKCFNPLTSKTLEQKYIINDGSEMSMEVKFSANSKDYSCSHHVHSVRRCSSTRGGLGGLYIFPLGSKIPDIFTKAGRYTFSFFIKNSDIKSFKAEVDVNPLPVASKWEVLCKIQYPWKLRMGQCLPCFDLACYDEYENRIPFSCIPKVDVTLNLMRNVSCKVNMVNMELSNDKLSMHFKDITIESNELDKIRPNFEATLVLCSPDARFSVTIPCQVTPGPLKNVEMLPKHFGDNLYPGCVIEKLELEFFDAYGNHALGGSVAVILVGFTFEDNAGSKREIDTQGVLNLSGLLKVTAEHGQRVSISLVSESDELRRMVFQTKKRILKLSSELPEYCYTGTQLLEVRFEVINDEGDIDEMIHNEDLQSHMLLISTDSPDYQFYSLCAFEHGCCTVPAISLPEKEGIIYFTATHSSYPDIHLRLKVKVIQMPDAENENIDYKSSEERFPLLVQETINTLPSEEQVEVIQMPNAENENIDYKSPEERFPLLAQETINMLRSEEQELYKAVLDLGKDIGVLEEELNSLQIQKNEIVLDMLALQELQSHNQFNSSSETIKLLNITESKSESAASLVCNLLTAEGQQEPVQSFLIDVVGIVSQLGNVPSEQLSRVLAEYLGEDQMLAIVCRTADAASGLQKCQDVNAIAATLGKPLLRRFNVICLEDIRPFTGGCIPSDYQMSLLLSNPTLENKDTPTGFLGYAVNMVNLDIAHVHIRTIAGHGLRETLFYRLFGELQVYETIDHMKQALACGCLNQTAVSLDGGIVRGNGVFSYGFGNPEVYFSVVTLEDHHLSQDEVETLQQLEERKMELAKIQLRIMWLSDKHQKYNKYFERKSNKYKEFVDRKGHLLRSGQFLEYNVSGSCNSS